MELNLSEELLDNLVNEEFARLDADNNGFIDYEEYAASVRERMKLLEINIDDEAILAQMKTVDLNNDSKISKEEYKNYFRQLLSKN